MATVVISQPAVVTCRIPSGHGLVTATATHANGDPVTIDPPTISRTTATFTLTPTQIGDQPDRIVLTVDTDPGSVTVPVDVVSHRLVDPRDVRDRIGNNPADDVMIRGAIEWFEHLSMRHCGVAFHRRYDTVTSRDGWAQVMPHAVPVWTNPATDLGTLDINGRVLSGLPSRPVTVGYVHGYKRTPAELSEAAMTAVVDLLRTQGERRATREFAKIDPHGFTTRISRATTLYRTGIDTVDSVLNDLSEHPPAVM